MKSLLTAFLVTLFALNAHGQTSRSTVRKSLSSVCFLMLQDKDDQPKKLGSGFFIKPGVIATSLPLLDGVASGYCKVAGNRTPHKIEGIIAHDILNQVALLKTDDNAGPPLILTDEVVSAGDEATLLACPKGLNGEFRNGTISGVHSKGENKFYEITSDILPSMNGGPVINKRGKVIGMAASFVVDGKSHTIVIPSYAMTDLLSKTGSPSFEQAKTKITLPKAKQLGKGVALDKFTYKKSTIRFSIINNLSETITGIKFLMILRDPDGSIRHSKTFEQNSLDLLPNLTKRYETGISNKTFVQSIDTIDLPAPFELGYNSTYYAPISTEHEIRILSVTTATEKNSNSKSKSSRGFFNR